MTLWIRGWWDRNGSTDWGEATNINIINYGYRQEIGILHHRGQTARMGQYARRSLLMMRSYDSVYKEHTHPVAAAGFSNSKTNLDFTRKTRILMTRYSKPDKTQRNSIHDCRKLTWILRYHTHTNDYRRNPILGHGYLIVTYNCKKQIS